MRPLGRVARHRGAVVDRLVVRVGVHEEQPTVSGEGHSSILSAGRDAAGLACWAYGVEMVHRLSGLDPVDREPRLGPEHRLGR